MPEVRTRSLSRPMHAALGLLAVALPVVAPSAQDQALTTTVAGAVHPGLDEVVERFARAGRRSREAAVEDVAAAVAAVGAGPFTPAAVIAGTLDTDAAPRLRDRRTKDLGRGSETAAAARPLVDQLPWSTDVVYRFGFGAVEALADARGRSRRANVARDVAALDALCAGGEPELDRAFAALLQRMDVERGFDRVAALLETWRNGDETIYEALDRTAGSGEGVFHYDAMIDDFVRTCVPSNHGDRRQFARSREDAYAGFRRAFEVWCGRRSTIEMVALACLLDPATPLPGRLARYENGGPGTHSLRELVELIVIAHDGDVLAACDAIVAEFPALDGEPWEGDRESWRAVVRAYEKVEPKLLAGTRSTFDQLADSRQARSHTRVARAMAAGRALVARFGS